MGDRFGLLELPVQAPVSADDALGDPLLAHLAQFAKAVCNRYGAAAWQSRATDANDASPVRTAFAGRDPRRYAFRDQDLPAVFVYRGRDKLGHYDESRRENASRIRFVWLAPHDPYNRVFDRLSFGNAIAKILDAAIDQGRDPSWVAAGDTSPYAATIDADGDSIKTAFTTSTSAQLYSGAALNGIVGGSVMSPRREPTITTTFVGGSVYETAQDIIVTALDWAGFTGTHRKRLTLAGGGETIGFGEDVKQIVSVSLPAMLTMGGSIQLGTSKVEGRGSVLREVLRVDRIWLGEWEAKQLPIEVLRKDGTSTQMMERRMYDAIEATIEAVEVFEPDVTDVTKYYPHDTAPYGVDINVAKDGLSVSKAALPDNAVD